MPQAQTKELKPGHCWGLLVQQLSTDSRLLYLIRASVGKDSAAAATNYLRYHLKKLGAPHDMTARTTLLADFLCYCNRPTPPKDLGDQLVMAIADRLKAKADLAMGHKHLVLKLGLNWKSERQEVVRDKHLASFGEPLYLGRLKTPYPPMNEWIVDSTEIWNLWYDHMHKGRQPDHRLKKHPFRLLEPAKIVKYVGPATSIIIRDKKTHEIVLVVMRDACKDEGAVVAVDATVSDATKKKKSVRLEDPGSIVQIGYSAGARSKPSFNWVRNVLSKSTDTQDLDKRTSSAFAFFWNLCRGWLPPEIITDTDDWLNRSQAPAMDASRQLDSSEGSYEVILNGIPFQFTNVRLAPPTGVMARNYARAIHRERQPHKYAISWTTSRNKGQEFGGSFFIAQYGIQVAPAANTIIAWRNYDAHGTSLQKITPDMVNDDEDPNTFCQAGLAFVTPNRLQGTWEKCLQGIIGEGKVWEVLEDDDDADIQYNWDEDDDEWA